MPSITETRKKPPTDLPIPAEHLFYPDAAYNSQLKKIAPFIDYVHYPTLGCPALLGPNQALQVLLNLPTDTDPATVAFQLRDRHGQPDLTFNLSRQGNPEELADGPGGERKLFRYFLKLDNLPFALFDLHLAFDGQKEIQYNSVRRYQAITGQEQVIFCGDSQYHGDNRVCLERFINLVNTLNPAWVALIGDICDNGVKSPRNLVRLAASAHPGPVTSYYEDEYQQAHELLRNLRHPVLLVPGNHDGMAAYTKYEEGQPSQVYTGPDSLNPTEYDGLHHFRRTFGPPYFRFDWGGTRYLCTNTFELTRQQRLGYHAIVANWGGWMRDEQVNWIKHELETAQDLRKVMLMHHDPRGGSEGQQLGRYHRMRPYTFDSTWPILKAYLSYALQHGGSTWQQEWMAATDGDVAGHPVQHLLRAMLQQEVWAVFMGHDNKNWVDSYFNGDDLFTTQATTMTYATRADVGNQYLVDNMVDLLEDGNYQALSTLLETEDEDLMEKALKAALGEIEQSEAPAAIAYAADPAKEWGLKVDSAIHFVHVDDVGAYKYTKESHFDDYGFVVARLDQGAPVEVQSHSTSGIKGQIKELLVD